MKKLLISPLLTLALMLCLVTPGNAALDFSNNYYPYTGQPTSGDYEVTNRTTMTMTGNIWTAFKLDTPITVRENSTISFSYFSNNLPEIAAIGFVKDTNKDGEVEFNYELDSRNAVKVAGTQGNNWPEEVFSPLYPASGSFVSYTLNLTSFLTIGDTFSFITFINDDDGAVGPNTAQDGMSVFSNVSLKNTSPTPLPAAALLLGTGLLGLVGIRRRNA